MITAGIDAGLRSVKVVLWSAQDRRILSRSKVPTDFDIERSVRQALRQACEEARIHERDLAEVACTGAGKTHTTFSDVRQVTQVSEVTSLAAGITSLIPTARTILELGAEEARAVKLDTQNTVQDFATNDRCAAGSGAFLEAMARALDLSVEELGRTGSEHIHVAHMSSQCVVFAETEVISMIHSGVAKPAIAAAIAESMAIRAAAMGRRVRLEPDLVLAGGVALSPIFAAALEAVTGLPVLVADHPQHVSALGAGIIAASHAIAASQPNVTSRNPSDEPNIHSAGPTSIQTTQTKPRSTPLDLASQGHKLDAPIGKNHPAANPNWQWPEGTFHDPKLDWHRAQRLVAGIDVGSVSSQAVILADGELLAYANIRTNFGSSDSARAALNRAMSGAGLSEDQVHFVVGTGYGRQNVPFAQKTATEIACHARGARFIYGPTVHTILDMGGQDCKAIRLDDRGKVERFVMNDRCAAGTGRGLEVFADLLAVPIDQVGDLSLRPTGPLPSIASMCVVFAKTEALGLLRQGYDKTQVLAAFCEAMAHRVVTLIRRVGVQADFVVTGGIAKNRGVVSRIEAELGLTALHPTLDTQIAGALGAALLADIRLKRRAK
ncbi:MAG: hypothetical protein J7M25_18825 [Deltaproteobacteria bacterium]|nr:hypothetical protein [Deltaproteobacteria bacterium]